MILALCSSVLIILSALQDWSDNPVLMSVDTFMNPMREVNFPAITLCQSPSVQPDNWALTEQVFNSFKYDCKYKSGELNQNVKKD